MGEDGPGNGNALIYIFTVWVLLIVAAWLLGGKLRQDDLTDENEEGG